MSYTAFLKTIAAFRSLATREVDRLSSQCELVRFQPKAQIIRKGDPGDAMFIIHRGEVRVPITVVAAAGESVSASIRSGATRRRAS